MRFSKIGDEGAKVLASGNLPNLTSLHLFCNNISAEGAEALANGNLINLTSLHLLCNDISDEGAKALANGNLINLTSLRLVANKIGNEGAKALANGNLPNLKLLHLGNHFDKKSVEALFATKNVRNLLSPDLSNNIGDKGIEALAKGNLPNLTSLELSSNNISAESAEALANGNLTNLKKLNLNHCKVGDEGAEALANGNLTNLKKLNLFSNNISAEGAEALAKDNLPNLTSLDLGCNNIGNKGAEALANVNLTKFTKFDLSYNNIDFEHIEVLARSKCSGIKLNNRDQKVFYDFLLKKCSNNQVVDKESIKKMIFNVARSNYSGDLVRYILTQPDKYPFLINSKDEQWHTLSHFYNHSPEIQEFLFKHGLVPEKDSTLRNITNDKQSVHAGLAVKKTKFITKNLVESIKASEGQLEQAVNSYVESIPKLLKEYQNDQVKIGLLGLKENEKKSVMEEVLNGGDVPSDEEFIKTVIDKAEQVLKQQYLKKNFHGEYDQGYPTQELQYDYTRDDAKITIPESIGYIKLLIDKFSVPLKEKKELLVTLMEQNPDLVKNKLSKVKEKLGNSVILDKEQFNKTELHELLNGIDDGKKVDELFKEISCLNIEEVWREQKEFVLLKQIYIAATTYGESSSACIQGTWTQIISSINEISSEIVAQYDRHLEEEQKLEAQKDVITKENITPFVENLAKKLIQYARNNPEFKEDLVDNFILRGIDLDRPENIQFEQQRALAKINQEFSANIKSFLPNYDRSIPKEDEYKIIIKELFKIKMMKDFALEEDDQPQILTQSNIKDLNQPVKESQSVYSKIGIGCSMVIGIAGVALGVAIAVHLEMLAMGIAVGAICCLVAAAIIYYCNEPSKSLEDNNVQRVSEKVPQPIV
ncbi:TomO hydrophobic C-terminal domain-containing protein [Wolbachia endosymbiont (group A) of Barypeithes pellucidus]|uniref:TomO hydrophobic C-terminal domain-containing protein n=1 Tax=Wolbachia endosymbiont (group A) of Barypeithes pellucidus TaxID=3139322 RepID=UPI003CCB43FB